MYIKHCFFADEMSERVSDTDLMAYQRKGLFHAEPVKCEELLHCITTLDFVCDLVKTKYE